MEVNKIKFDNDSLDVKSQIQSIIDTFEIDKRFSLKLNMKNLLKVLNNFNENITQISLRDGAIAVFNEKKDIYWDDFIKSNWGYYSVDAQRSYISCSIDELKIYLQSERTRLIEFLSDYNLDSCEVDKIVEEHFLPSLFKENIPDDVIFDDEYYGNIEDEIISNLKRLNKVFPDITQLRLNEYGIVIIEDDLSNFYYEIHWYDNPLCKVIEEKTYNLYDYV